MKKLIRLALLALSLPAFAQSSAPSSNAKSPASVTHLTLAEQTKLDQVRALAAKSEDWRPVQAEIDAIVKNHPGYHWEDHGILSDKSGLVLGPTPATKVN